MSRLFNNGDDKGVFESLRLDGGRNYNPDTVIPPDLVVLGGGKIKKDLLIEGNLIVGGKFVIDENKLSSGDVSVNLPCRDPFYICSVESSHIVLKSPYDNINEEYIELQENSTNILEFEISLVFLSDNAMFEFCWEDESGTQYGNTGILIKNDNFVSQNRILAKIKCLDEKKKIKLSIKRSENVQLSTISSVGYIEHRNT